MRIGKLLAAIIGVPTVIVGLAMTFGGAVALAVPDDDGWVSAGPLHMRTEAVGFVGEGLHLDFDGHVGDGRTFIGWDVVPARVEVESRNGKEVFVGVARTADARDYLAGIAVDRVESLHGDTDLVHLGGATSVAPPSSQNFWVATDTSGAVEWSLVEGDWSVVVLNADGSSGVDVAVTGSARIPFLPIVGGGLIAFGVIGVIVGSLLTYFGVRSVTYREPTPSAPTPTAPVATG